MLSFHDTFNSAAAFEKKIAFNIVIISDTTIRGHVKSPLALVFSIKPYYDTLINRTEVKYTAYVIKLSF